MNLRDVLEQAEVAGVELLAEGDNLRLRCPAGALSDELRALLAEHKPAILERLPRDRDQAIEMLNCARTIRPELLLFDVFLELIHQYFAAGNIIMVAHAVTSARRILTDLASSSDRQARTA